MRIDEMLVPLFSYDTSTNNVDINYQGGNVLYVINVITGINDPAILLNKNLVSTFGIRKKVIDVSKLSIERVDKMLTFVDMIAKSCTVSEKAKWNEVYSLLSTGLKNMKQSAQNII